MKHLYYSLAATILCCILVACGSSSPKYEDPIEQAFYKATNITPDKATFESSGGYLIITYTLTDTPHDYTDYVSKALTTFVKTGKEIFSSTDITSLRMDMKVDDGVATSLIIAKDNFNSIDWESEKFLDGIYDKIVDKFDKFYVESMLMKGVDTNKIQLKGF